MTAQLTRFQTKVTLAREDVAWGTASAGTYVALPVTEIRENNVADVIRDQGLRGVSAREFTSQQGSLHAEITMGGLVYPELIGHILMGMFGQYDPDINSGAPVGPDGDGLYVHDIIAYKDPPSYTVEVQSGTAANSTLQYKGARFSKLDLTFEAATGGLAFSSELSSIVGARVSPQNPSPTTPLPFTGWACTVGGTTALTPRVISAEFHAMRELQLVHTLRNSQHPYNINVGPLGVEGAVVMTVADYSDYALWLAHTTGSLEFTFTYGSGAGARTFAIAMTNCNVGNGPLEIDRSAVGITFKLNFLGLYNSTDGGAARMQLTNTQVTY